jgi:tRNA(fMet)-specific endonuclease VapC
MARRLILDTGVVIAADRRRLDLRQIIGDDDPAIAAITAMELLAGVERSSPTYRDMIALGAESFLSVMPIEQYDIRVARMHALLTEHTRRTGRPRGSHDMIIAATAGATGRTLVTTDKAANFADLPGIAVEVVDAD